MIFPMEVDDPEKFQIRRSMTQLDSSCIFQLMKKVPELVFKKILLKLKIEDIKG